MLRLLCINKCNGCSFIREGIPLQHPSGFTRATGSGMRYKQRKEISTPTLERTRVRNIR